MSTVEKLIVAFPVIKELHRGGKIGFDKYVAHKQSKRCGVKISKNNWIASALGEWALKTSGETPMALDAKFDTKYRYEEKKEDFNLRYLAHSSFSFFFNVDGLKIKFFSMEGDPKTNEQAQFTGAPMDPGYYYLEVKNLAQLNQLKTILQKFHDQQVEKRINSGTEKDRKNFKVYSSAYGGWHQYRRELRPLNTVVLEKNQLETITADLDKFLKSRESYISKGLPWRRGYLFWGEPGTGKSSLIKGLSSEFDMDLYYISLADMKSDSDLISAVSDIRGKGILLLEDVDVFDSTSERKNKGKGVSMSALLNVLDGPATPDGLVTMMTTNHRDKLDPALIRKGRIDCEQEIKLPTIEEVKSLWSVFYNQAPQLEAIPVGYPTSYYFDVFKTNMEDPEKARDEIILAVTEQEYAKEAI